jgi:competence protein ComEA
MTHTTSTRFPLLLTVCWFVFALWPFTTALAGTHTLTGVVNLNTATPEQLDLLPGVGEKAVTRIVAYRAKQPFRRVEELHRVKGFGRKKVLKLKPFLTVTGDTTLRALTPAELEATPRTAP